MEKQEVTLMKGNEAIAHAAVRCGVDGFFGYPITPQTEIIETLSLLKPWETTGMVVVQAESEVASINMVYGAAGAGKRVFTTSSSPGVALMQEGISYMAGAEVPGVVITSLELKSEVMELRNIALQNKYRQIEEAEVRFETQQLDDAEYMIVAFGSAARIAEKGMKSARKRGMKVGLFRPITLWPFPKKQIAELAKGKKGILVVEINAGQMVQDVRLAINGKLPVEHFGRLGGIVPDPEEIVTALETKLVKE